MSALHPIADMWGAKRDVCFVPIATNAHSKKTSLFDHLVGAQHEAGGDLVADRLCGLEIDHQFEPGRLLDRKIGRLSAAQHLGDQPRPLTENLREARAVA